MLLLVKKFVVALFLPLVALFSFSGENSDLESPKNGIANSVSGPADVIATDVEAKDRAGENAQNKPKPGGNAPSGALSYAAIKNCLGRAGRSGDCLDSVFGGYLKTHSTKEALAAVEKLESEDAELHLTCHPVIHAIGRETFRVKKTIQDSFQACDQSCHSGCYHGAMERFLRGDDASSDSAGHISEDGLEDKAVSACDTNQPTRFRFQCLHGLGHAIVFFTDYNLERSLEICDRLPDQWGRSSCYGGEFMENIFAADKRKRDLSATDYHYPCDKLADRYKADCYMMQTTRMSEMGLGTAQLFSECQIAGVFRFNCMQSVGRDLSNDVRVGDPRLVAQKCELVGGEDRQACTRGVIYALMDNTWDGRYAFPFCRSLALGDDRTYCFASAASYLKATYAQSPEEIKKQCRSHLNQPQNCLDAVGF